MSMRFTPDTILSEYSAIAAINSNFSEIATLLDEMLSRAGDGTNSMQTNLDMNHFKISNIANAEDSTDVPNLGQVTSLIGDGGTVGPTGAKGDPGSNVMSIGLFTIANTLTIPTGTNVVRTSGHSVDGKGGAEYVHDTGVDSTYVATWPNVSFIDAGGRGFKLSMDQIHNWYMFGLKVDDDTGTPTNDYAAWTAMLNWMQTNIKTGGAIFQYGVGAAKPIWCFGAAYFGANTSTIDWAANLQGFSSGLPGASPTQIRWDDNTNGIIFGADKNQHAAGFRIEGFTLMGGWTDLESESYGLQWHTKGIRKNLQFYNWGGDAMLGNNTNSTTGNSNGDVTDRIFVQNCRFAHSIIGNDTNGGQYDGIVVVGNRQGGIYEQDSLGSEYSRFELEANARSSWNTGLDANHPASYCFSGGHFYACVNGQETWCQTNGPTGTTSSNQGWAYWQDQGAASPSTGVPQWNTGMYWRAGGAIIHKGASSMSLFRGYIEQDECAQLDQYGRLDYIIGAPLTNFFSVRSGVLALFSNGILQRPNGFAQTNGGFTRVRNHLVVSGNFVHEFNGQFLINAVAGGATQDVVMQLKNNNVSSKVSFLKSDGTEDGYVLSTSTQNMYINHKNGINFRAAGSDITTIDSTGLNLLSGKVLKVNGIQVIGARNTGWTADTGTAEKTAHATYDAGTALTFSATYTQSELTALATRLSAVETALQNVTRGQKALKDAMITHGLIGT